MKTTFLPPGQRGLGLIELMVALLLGLLVTGSAVMLFQSNRQAYAATESIGRIQENARMAYELMARDLREAGGTPCSHSLPMANVTYDKSSTTPKWWQDWGNGVSGYKMGTTTLPLGAPAGMVTKGDALVVLESDDTPLPVVSHDNVNGKFTVNASPAAISAQDIVVVCDYRQGSMFQVKAGGVDTVNNTISYNKSGMNCTKDLSMPTNCASVKNGIQYGNNAMIGRLRSVAWYIHDNTHGGTSLYQSQLGSTGTAAPQEIVEGVTGMTVTYLTTTGTDYVAADVLTAPDWKNVIAVRIALTMQGGQGQEHVSTTGNGALSRTIVQTISLRDHQS